MAHAQLDPAFHERFVSELIERRRAALAEHVRAELPGLDPSLAADVVFGALWYRLLTRPPKVPAGYEVAPYDEAELDRLRAAGIDDPEDDPTVLVASSVAGAPRFWFQRVPESTCGFCTSRDA